MKLEGAVCLVTRAAGQAGPLAGALAARGARVVEAPVIGFEDPVTWAPVDAAITSIAVYDRLVFTSANAVDRFFDRLRARGGTPDAMAGRVVAIGPATARALAARGCARVEVARDARAEGLVDLLVDRPGRPLHGARILIPRAEKGRDHLPDALRSAGARVDVVTVYRTVPIPLDPSAVRMLDDGKVDVITFTSGSTVTSFLDGVRAARLAAPAVLRGVVIGVIGPVTARACRDAGVVVDVIAQRADVESLVEALALHRRGSGPGA